MSRTTSLGRHLRPAGAGAHTVTVAPHAETPPENPWHKSVQHIIDGAGITRVTPPPQSPNLNAYAEWWVRSVKAECLSRLILFGEVSLRYALMQCRERLGGLLQYDTREAT